MKKFPAMLALCIAVPLFARAEGAGAHTGYDWASLASVAGASAFTLLVVQYIKAPLDRWRHIPTRPLVYLIAFCTLLVARLFTVGFSWEGLALTAVNAVVAANAAMGAYEVTFAARKADEGE